MFFLKKHFTPPEQNYFSIDDILATNERVSCRFEVNANKLGYLDPSSESPDLKARTKLELPLWMAQSLHSRHIITVEMPKVYREGYKEILDADADVVNLHKMGPYFYHMGIYLSRFPHGERGAISSMLNQTFRHRFRKLMDSSQNSFDEDVTSLTFHLDEMEKVLFNIGQKSLYDLKKYEKREVQKIETAELVISYRKRRRAVLEKPS